MSNISGSINLASLEHAIKELGKNKNKCIIIPIAANHLTVTDKGNCYLNISGREYINEEKKQTHIVSQSVPKEVYEKLKAEGKYAPTLGNFTDWDKLSGGSGESAPNASDVDVTGGDDGLPF